tara:strand:+ start:92 stop:433 length:342 start_codon:yes stop_codon:yes gene_type:complete
MNIEEFKEEIERLNRKKLPIELWVQAVFSTATKETIDEIEAFLKDCPEVMTLVYEKIKSAPDRGQLWNEDFLLPPTRLLKGQDPKVAKMEYIERNREVVEVLRERIRMADKNS